MGRQQVRGRGRPLPPAAGGHTPPQHRQQPGDDKIYRLDNYSIAYVFEALDIQDNSNLIEVLGLGDK